MQSVGQRLKRIRQELNMNQEQFGALFDIKGSGVGKHELGNCFPTRKMIRVLSSRYNISMDWLLCGRGSMYYDKEDFAPGPNHYKIDGEIRDLLVMMTRSTLVRYAVMSFFQRFKIENMELIQKESAASNPAE